MLVTHQSRRTIRMSSSGLLQSAHRNRRATFPHVYRRSVSSIWDHPVYKHYDQSSLSLMAPTHVLNFSKAAVPSAAQGQRRHRRQPVGVVIVRGVPAADLRGSARRAAAKTSGGLFATTPSNSQSAGVSPAKAGSSRRRSEPLALSAQPSSA